SNRIHFRKLELNEAQCCWTCVYGARRVKLSAFSSADDDDGANVCPNLPIPHCGEWLHFYHKAVSVEPKMNGGQ
ncbi:hypothetical protein HID58_002467, partial [Brassica napus]